MFAIPSLVNKDRSLVLYQAWRGIPPQPPEITLVCPLLLSFPHSARVSFVVRAVYI